MADTPHPFDGIEPGPALSPRQALERELASIPAPGRARFGGSAEDLAARLERLERAIVLLAALSDVGPLAEELRAP